MKRVLIYSAVLLAIFMVWGYFFSDAFYFKQIIRQQHIKSPEESFVFLKHQTEPINFKGSRNIVSGLSPRYLLEKRKYLWCDEGAILQLIFARRLGHKTRLVDMLDSTGTSHHTVAQVLQNETWKTYDYTFNHMGSLQQSTPDIGFIPRYRIRPYPQTANLLMQNNYFIAKLVQLARSVKEPESPDFSGREPSSYRR